MTTTYEDALKDMLKQAEADLAAARAEIERLTKAHDTVCGALAKAIKRAKKAKSALEAYGREKVREGMQRAANIAGQHTAILPHYNDITRGYANGRSGARDAILAAMKKEGGE